MERSMQFLYKEKREYSFDWSGMETKRHMSVVLGIITLGFLEFSHGSSEYNINVYHIHLIYQNFDKSQNEL